MNLRARSFVFFIACLAFIGLAEVFDLKMFRDKVNDGFYSQISYISMSVESASIELSPLFIIHAMRLLAVLPFFICDVFDLPSYAEAIAFIFYLFPFMKFKRGGFMGYIPIVFMLLPFVFSYRAVLGMIGMLYLYICLFYESGSYRLLLSSALLANLSSGIVLSWAIAVIGSNQYVRSNYKRLTPLFILMFLGFLGSILNKYDYMFAAAGANENGGALERSTLYVSYIEGQYFRLGSYMGVIFLVFFILAMELFKSYSSQRKLIFFLGAIPTMFFEGLGLISYLMCILIFLYNDILFNYRYSASQ